MAIGRLFMRSAKGHKQTSRDVRVSVIPLNADIHQGVCTSAKYQ
jgi:hypothetical protein